MDQSIIGSDHGKVRACIGAITTCPRLCFETVCGLHVCKPFSWQQQMSCNFISLGQYVENSRTSCCFLRRDSKVQDSRISCNFFGVTVCTDQPHVVQLFPSGQ
jgi:NAD(P)H-flavin reductase